MNIKSAVTSFPRRRESSVAAWIPTFVGMTAILLLPTLGLPACSKFRSSQTPASSTKALYHCAMHPQIVSDHPGECPICHMKLTPIENSSERKILFYRNPMNPAVTSPVPAKDGMGMDYIPVYEGAGTAETSVPGLATIHMTSDVEQKIGVKVSPVEKRELSVSIRAAARVAYDPALYSALVEHREARTLLDKARQDKHSDLTEQAEATVKASRLRLRQMGLSESQIEEMSREDVSDLLIGSKGGHVWVYADVYDAEANLIHAGQMVDLTSPALPGETFEGKVGAIDRILNSESRTLRVRIRVQDPQGRLRPEAFFNAVIHASLGNRLSVPRSAVLDTGIRQLVYVQKEPGTYEPREVKTGHSAGDDQEILEGLREGEKVASAANFLIDSESRIQAATQKASKEMGAR